MVSNILMSRGRPVLLLTGTDKELDSSSSRSGVIVHRSTSAAAMMVGKLYWLVADLRSQLSQSQFKENFWLWLMLYKRQDILSWVVANYRVAVDHKPLLGLLNNKSLAGIENPWF